MIFLDIEETSLNCPVLINTTPAWQRVHVLHSTVKTVLGLVDDSLEALFWILLRSW
jgi:hypothetical protein